MRCILLMVLLLSLMLYGCPRGPELPAQPGLLSDDFGVGLKLMMPLQEAQVLGEIGGVELRILSTDQLMEISGYDTSRDEDEIAAVYYSADAGDNDPLGGRISDIRCFINTGTGSPVRLLGKQVAGMGANDIEGLLGEPQKRTESSGQIHLEYLFDSGLDEGEFGIRLITSHHLDKSCYAFRVSLEPRN